MNQFVLSHMLFTNVISFRVNVDSKNVENKGENEAEFENDFKPEDTLEMYETEPAQKKSRKGPRKSYSYFKKAEILDKYYKTLADDPNLSLSTFGKEIGIDKAMVFRWIQDKDSIFQKASDDKVCHLKKGRGSTKHLKTYPKLYQEFINMRERGQKVSFNWFWIKGKIIAKDIQAPTFTRSATQAFLKHYNLKVRRIQRKKQKDKADFLERIREWHLNLREGLIKSGKSKPTFDEKWGRFKPHQRLNVDQVCISIFLVIFL